jgi:hypothetical protein
MTSWHVNIFRIRKTRRSLLGQRKKVVAGHGWSASSPDGGYLFHEGVSKDEAAALADATTAIEAAGGTVGTSTLDDTELEEETPHR